MRLAVVRERGGRMTKEYPTSLFEEDRQYFGILDNEVMQQKDITEQMIKALHHHMLVEKEAAAAGIYREIDVLVRKHRVVPPNGIANAMSEFCIWFNTKQENNDMDAATFAANAHNRFVRAL
ncbi:hypothetical protein niasHS_001785 [Heterodera schachtii]|uniref:Fido domain-containing protein n=1 Tax=Heterodera schachtii TaxID=97005 RepID=A0ABD2K1L2_HETSC